MTSRKRTLRRRRSRSAVCTVAAAGVLAGMLLGTARPAQAELTAAAVWVAIKEIKEAYEIYEILNGWLNPTPAPPTLADIAREMRVVQDAVIAEMRTQRNSAIRAGARTALNLFNDLADNQASDPVNTSLWSNTRTESQRVADQMFDIIVNVQDKESAYELGPVYNTLLVSGIGVIRVKGQIWPSFPSSWNDHHVWLQAGMFGNYKLIGSQFYECSAGANPGYDPVPRKWTVKGRLYESLLWKKLTNRWMTVRTFPCGSTRCNASTMECISQINTGCHPDPNGTVTSACGNNSISDKDCIVILNKPTFDANNVVKIVREGMIGIQKLSGGTEGEFNDALVSQGSLVDPWVPENSCAYNQRAYAQVP